MVGAPDRYSYDRFLHTEVVDTFEYYVTAPYKDKSFLLQKYIVERMSPRQIATRFLFSRQSVYKYLRLHGIPLRPEDILLKRQVEYGKKNVRGLIVASHQEQKHIATMLRFRKLGYSYEKTAEALNAMNVKTKRGGKKWYAHSVYKILKRVRK